MSNGTVKGESRVAKSGSLLSSIDLEQLRSIKVAIRRADMPNAEHHQAPLKRRLESPELLTVHLKGTTGRKIFWRDDVIPNIHEVHEEHYFTKQPARHKNEEQDDNAPSTSKDSSYKKSLKPIFGNYINSAPSYPLPPEDDEGRDHGYGKRKPLSSTREEAYASTSKDYKKYKPKSDRYSPKGRYYESPTRHQSRSPSPSRQRTRDSSYSPRYRSAHYKDRQSPAKRPGLYIPKKKLRSPSLSPEAQTSRHSSGRRRRQSQSPGRSEDYRHRAYKRSSKSRSQSRFSRSPPRYKHEEERSKKRSRSPHVKPHSSRDESYRSRKLQTPPRPGEYRPDRRRSIPKDRRVSRSPSSRVGEFKPRRKSRSPYHHSRMREPPDYHGPHHKPYDMAGPSPAYIICDGPGWNATFLRPPFSGQWPPRPIMAPSPAIYQIIPHPFPQRMRPPIIRPLKQYNNRVIPNLTSAASTSAAATSTVTSSNTKNDGQSSESKKPDGDHNSST